jgi:drug/metabolite transporter (DMT)-like permease
MLLSLTCSGLIGIFIKLADTRDCKPGAIYTFAYCWSLLFSVFSVISFRGAAFHVPAVVYAIALPFGVVNAIGVIVFMAGLRYGKISTSWLIISLSGTISAVGSVVIYHEPVNLRKIAALILAVFSVLLLGKDKQDDEAKQTRIAAEPKDVA